MKLLPSGVRMPLFYFKNSYRWSGACDATSCDVRGTEIANKSTIIFAFSLISGCSLKYVNAWFDFSYNKS